MGGGTGRDPPPYDAAGSSEMEVPPLIELLVEIAPKGTIFKREREREGD